jgi:hypothetical protein
MRQNNHLPDPLLHDAKTGKNWKASIFAEREIASLSLREHREPRSEQEIHLDFSNEGITDSPVHHELLLFCKIRHWRVFKRPEVMPTSTRNDGSGIGCTATDYNPFIPVHSICWLDEVIWLNA